VQRESRDEPSRFEFTARLIDAIMRRLAGDPICELGESRGKILFRDEADFLLGPADSGEAMPDIAGAKLAGDFGREILAVHRLRQTARHVLDT
jgi:hypothetical protein